MSDLNKWAGAGRVMSLPRVTTAGNGNSNNGGGEANGNKMARFTLACHRAVRDPQEPNGWAEKTDKIAVVCWGRLAEKAERLGVGAYLTATGRLQTYERVVGPPENGTVVQGFEIALDDFNSVIRGRENEAGSGPGERTPSFAAARAHLQGSAVSGESEGEEDEEVGESDYPQY